MHDIDQPRRSDIAVLLTAGHLLELVMVDGVELPQGGMRGSGNRLKLAPGPHEIVAVLRSSWGVHIKYIHAQTADVVLEGGHTYLAVSEVSFPTSEWVGWGEWTFHVKDITAKGALPSGNVPRLGEWLEREPFYGTSDNPVGLWRTAYQRCTWCREDRTWRIEVASLAKHDIRRNEVLGQPLFERPMPSYGDLFGMYKLRIDDREYLHAGQVVTGHGLLELAQRLPAEDFSVYRHLTNGQTVAIALDEQVDLKPRGVEHFTTNRGGD